jgi:hypothetical protein
VAVEGIERMDEHELFGVWDALAHRRVWETARDRGGDPEVVARELDRLPEVSAVEALEANRRLVELLVGRRWFVMLAAREAGASWEEIGAALGVSREEALAAYDARISAQEQHVGDLHDAERARRVIPE